MTDQLTDEALLPCPFCGGEAAYQGAAIRCTSFSCNTSIIPNWATKPIRAAFGNPDERLRIAKAQTAQRWNRRAAPADDLRAENERLRAIMATIISRCDTAKQQCREGAPVSAFNLACGILGQIGSARAALSQKGGDA